MYLEPLLHELRFLPNQKWVNFYEVLHRLEKRVPQYFIPDSQHYITHLDLIRALCYGECPSKYECKNIELHLAEWEIRRVRVFD